MLQLQKVLKDYNKELLSFAQEREAEYVKAAPQPLGAKFPGDAAEHTSQLEALRRAKVSNSSSNSSFMEGMVAAFRPAEVICSEAVSSPYSRPAARSSTPGKY